MPKTAIDLAERWIALLAAVLVCGCTPYRLEVGPYVAQDDNRDRFENLLETVLADHLKSSSGVESRGSDDEAKLPDRTGEDNSIALVGHSETDKAVAVDGRGETASDDAAERAGVHDDVREPALHTSLPDHSSTNADHGAQSSRPTVEYAGSSADESAIAMLDRELQLLRAEREALKHPRDELLRTGQQGTDVGAADVDTTDGDGMGKDVDQPRRRLNDLLSRLAAHGLKRKSGSKTPRLLENSLRAAKPLEPTGAEETVASATVSDSARRPIDRKKPLCKPALSITTVPDDPFASGKALFRDGDYDGALEAFSRIESEGLSKADRLLLRYLAATCLRKQGRWEEAQAEYAAVANSQVDEVLADNARWQLGTIRWRRDLEEQVGKLRQLQQNSPQTR